MVKTEVIIGITVAVVVTVGVGAGFAGFFIYKAGEKTYVPMTSLEVTRSMIRRQQDEIKQRLDRIQRDSILIIPDSIKLLQPPKTFQLTYVETDTSKILERHSKLETNGDLHDIRDEVYFSNNGYKYEWSVTKDATNTWSLEKDIYRIYLTRDSFRRESENYGYSESIFDEIQESQKTLVLGGRSKKTKKRIRKKKA
jgi:hypothetical protein